MSESSASPYTPLLNAIREPTLPPALSVFGKVLTVMVAVASITMGSVYFRDCPAQYLIPYYLIISGASSVLLLFLASLPCGYNSDPPEASVLMVASQGLLVLFKIAFFIAGNVWIYSIYSPNYTNHAAANYCHKVLYLYAFWVTMASYILLGLMIIISCCILICLFALWSNIPRGPRPDSVFT
ncbi:transmembrane protein 272-like [Lissotriton helveticus]